MGIENYIKRWAISESTTTIIAVGDKLHIDRVGSSPRVKFRCSSSIPAISESWGNVDDCNWFKNGGPAGHLSGTILDASGNSFPLVVTYAENSPDKIHIEIVAMPVVGGEVVLVTTAGGAAGEDDPP